MFHRARAGVDGNAGDDFGAGGDEVLEVVVAHQSEPFEDAARFCGLARGIEGAGPDFIGAEARERGRNGCQFSGGIFALECVFFEDHDVLLLNMQVLTGNDAVHRGLRDWKWFRGPIFHFHELGRVALETPQGARTGEPGEAASQRAYGEGEDFCLHDLDAAGVADLLLVVAFALLIDRAEEHLVVGVENLLRLLDRLRRRGPGRGPEFAAMLEQHALQARRGDDREAGDAFAHDWEIDDIDAGAGADVERGARVEGEEVLLWSHGSGKKSEI